MGGFGTWTSLVNRARAMKEPPAPVMDAATLGQLNIDLASAERDFWKTAPERRREAEKADPAPGSQEEVDLAEINLNRVNREESDFLEATRFDFLSREIETGQLQGRRLVEVKLFVDGLRTQRERLAQKVRELTERHRSLLTARRLRDRERPTPVEPEPSPKMVASLDGYFFGL